MRIGYFITHFPYDDRSSAVEHFERYKCGGAEITSYYLALNMAKRGHEIHVFTSAIDSKDSVEKNENISIHRYGSNLKIENGNVAFKMFQKPLDCELDVIHAHLSTPPTELAALHYARKKGTPLVITYHGDWHESYGGLIRRISLTIYNKCLLNRVLSKAERIISPSKRYIDESRFLGEYRDKIVVIPNGVNIKDFEVPYSKEECKRKLGLKNNENVILFVGNFNPYKGPDVLVKAMTEITNDAPNTALILVGSGKMRKELEELVKRLGIEDYVRFAGFIGKRLKPLYYRAADVFALPTLSESFGIVNLEAMACGLPIVASKIGGIQDTVKDHENGLLVSPREPKALASSIICLFQDEDLRNKMAENARKKVKDYSWERIAEATERVYNNTVKASN